MWILLQRGTSQALLQAQTKQWLAVREKRLPLPPLSPKVLAFIKEWYFLVDTDGSGELSLDEVAAAMRVSSLTVCSQIVVDSVIPCCSQSKPIIDNVPGIAKCNLSAMVLACMLP